MENNKVEKQLDNNAINYKPIFIIMAILSIFTTLLIDHYTPLDYKKIMRISLISLFSGLIIENYRINKNKKLLFYILCGAYTLSLTFFLVNKSQAINSYLSYWPFYFIIIFLIISVVLHSEKLTQKLTEGFTLLISLAFLYWLFDKSILNFKTIWNSITTLITILISGFTIFNSLSDLQLTKGNRLFLSIWTTIVVLIISLDNSYSVLKNIDKDYNYISDNLFLVLQYFLLGISSVYTAQNLNLIYSLLDKDTRIKAKKVHTNRYSETQVSINDSIFCIVFSIVIYFTNIQFNILPINLIIWLVIFVFPFLLEIKKSIFKSPLKISSK